MLCVFYHNLKKRKETQMFLRWLDQAPTPQQDIQGLSPHGPRSLPSLPSFHLSLPPVQPHHTPFLIFHTRQAQTYISRTMQEANDINKSNISHTGSTCYMPSTVLHIWLTWFHQTLPATLSRVTCPFCRWGNWKVKRFSHLFKFLALPKRSLLNHFTYLSLSPDPCSPGPGPSLIHFWSPYGVPNTVFGILSGFNKC